MLLYSYTPLQVFNSSGYWLYDMCKVARWQVSIFTNNNIMVTFLYCVLANEIVTLWEDEFLAGFKPLSTAVRPLCKVPDASSKVEYTNNN